MSSCWAASVSAEGRGGGQVCPGSRGRGGREEGEGRGEEKWLRRSAQRHPLGKASRTRWWSRGVLATFLFSVIPYSLITGYCSFQQCSFTREILFSSSLLLKILISIFCC